MDRISVTDNGVGFEAKDKDQPFGVFKRMHKADQFEGTGVGLAIVRRTVLKHQGKVWAESAVGAGTAIHILLPREAMAQGGLPFARVA